MAMKVTFKIPGMAEFDEDSGFTLSNAQNGKRDDAEIEDVKKIIGDLMAKGYDINVAITGKIPKDE